MKKPAEASCMAPDMDKLLKQGKTVGVVTRTDDGRGTRSTYRVEAEIGGDLRAEVSGPPDGRAEGDPYVLQQGLAALIFEGLGDRLVRRRRARRRDVG